MKGISLSIRVVATRQHISTRLEDGLAMLHVSSGRYFGLDPVAARIWDLIQVPKAAAELLATLVEEFDVTGERAEQDLFAFLHQLETSRLIDVLDAEIRDEATGPLPESSLT